MAEKEKQELPKTPEVKVVKTKMEKKKALAKELVEKLKKEGKKVPDFSRIFRR